MKKTFLTILILSLSVLSLVANEYHPVDLYFKDGGLKSGFGIEIDLHKDNYILFKISENADIEKYELEELTKIVYNINDSITEYSSMNVYKAWKQKKIVGPKWLMLIKKGTASLYETTTWVSSNMGKPHQTSTCFKEYYIIRDGEPAAKLISQVASFNNNQTFRAKAPIYFSDYPELAEKIKNKEYKWDDILEVVDIYNKWALN